MKYCFFFKVTLLFRFLEDRPVKKSSVLKSVLSHAFCCLIASVDDINVFVSQRAVLSLGTIHDNAVRVLVASLEHQVPQIGFAEMCMTRK